MTLIPDATTRLTAALVGDLAVVPWQRPFGRRPRRRPESGGGARPAPLEGLRDLALAGVAGEHRSQDYRAVTAGELEVGWIDGSLTRVPDAPATRAAFGSAGAADDASPFRGCGAAACDASTRAALGVATGPCGAGADGTRARPSRCCWTRR